MPSPVAHSLAGVIIGVLWQRVRSVSDVRVCSKALLFCVAAACVPDVDYLPGIFVGKIDAFHQQITHSFSLALLAPVAGVWLYGASQTKQQIKAYIVFCLSYLSHIILDLMMMDRWQPLGLEVWAPFSAKRLHLNVNFFFPLERRDVFSWENGVAVLTELVFFGAILLFVLVFNRYIFGLERNYD